MPLTCCTGVAMRFRQPINNHRGRPFLISLFAVEPYAKLASIVFVGCYCDIAHLGKKGKSTKMTHLPLDTTVAMSPRLVQAVRTTSTLSPGERLFLAKTLLDTLVADDLHTVVAPPAEPDYLPISVAEVVAQIKATPPNPNQIQRATKTVDEVFAGWAESPTTEPPLTTAEWEQNWWAIRQEMQQRDQQPESLVDQLADDHG